tara:strand:+ start:2803 stop:4215 length:1413 start_codon:yes stop_codon:yes gene_type:complete
LNNINKKDFFNKIANRRFFWKKIHNYYHSQLKKYYKFYVLPNSSVLELGCGNGDLLNSLIPSKGVGIDFSKKMIEISKLKYPNMEFYNFDLNNKINNYREKFDYVIISDLIRDLEDIHLFFENLRDFCNQNTRIIISYSNKFWEPVLKIAEIFKIKTPEFKQNWIGVEDLRNIVQLCDFEIVKENKKILIPFKFPLINFFFNNLLANLPFFRKFNLINFTHLRYKTDVSNLDKSVSIIIPTQNEKGNIENAIKRIPNFGKSIEIIFVEGKSKDNTFEEILRVKEVYNNKKILVIKQKGIGKGNAVREGFNIATGEIMMILDADLTVQPEELVKFYKAIINNKGEFINGSRFVYPLEKRSMRFLNILGNKFFTSLLSYSINQNLTDTLCGTKVLYKKDYLKIDENRSFFGEFDPFGDFDLIFGAARLSLKIIDIPIRYKERSYGSTQISRFSHGWQLIKMTFFALIKIKLN